MTRARDIANQGAGTYGSITADDLTVDTSTLVVDDTNNRVGIGTTSPDVELHVYDSSGAAVIKTEGGTSSGAYHQWDVDDGTDIGYMGDGSNLIGGGSQTDLGIRAQNNLIISSGGTTERMRIDSSGNLLVGGGISNRPADASGSVSSGFRAGMGTGASDHPVEANANGTIVAIFNRTANDGEMVRFNQDGTAEGSISVSGTAVSYNGGHLSRWSRLADDSKDTSIVKGTVMTNLDEMVVWSHDAVEAQDAVYETQTDEEGNEIQVLVSEAVEAKEAYTEDNEQLNKMAVSSVEGDPNVAGVFVNWDEDDDFNDMNIAMTGDMVIRIAQGTTVQRGDLLMSAGDGTAKPQGDDIVRSKTIAKVTSTHVSHTYDDGSYLVPCVLMAC